MKHCKTMNKWLVAIALMMATASNAMAQNTTNGNEADLDAKYATELIKAGETAPDFELATADGKKLRLSDFKGKYVVIDFWASWCPDCRRDLPNMARMQKTYGERGVQFIGVSFDDKKENLEKAIAQYQLTYPQVSEWKKWKETAISAAYNIKWIPSVYLIDPQGKVVLSTVMSEKIEAELAKIMPSCCEGNDNAQATCCKKEAQAGCCKNNAKATR